MPTFDKIEVVLFRSLWKINFSHLINLPAWKWKWFTVEAWSSQWCWEYGGRCRLEGGRSQGRFDHYINCPLPPPAPHHCHHIWTHSQDYQADTDQEIHLTLIFDLTWQVLCNAVTLGSISYSWEILKICIRQWHLQIYAKMNDIPSPGRKSRCIYRQAIEEYHPGQTFYELFNPSPTMCSQCSPDRENTSGGWWHLRGAQYLLRSHDRVQLWLNICAFSAFSNSMSFIYYKS